MTLAVKTFDRPRDALLGQPLAVLFRPGGIARGTVEIRNPEPGSAEACGHAENDRWMQRGNRSAFWATGATTAIRDASVGPTGYLKSLRNRTVIREHTVALRDERDALAGARDAAASRLANGAHELRNPPGAITSGVEVLRRLADSTDARVDETAARVAPDRAVRAARR